MKPKAIYIAGFLYDDPKLYCNSHEGRETAFTCVFGDVFDSFEEAEKYILEEWGGEFKGDWYTNIHHNNRYYRKWDSDGLVCIYKVYVE